MFQTEIHIYLDDNYRQLYQWVWLEKKIYGYYFLRFDFKWKNTVVKKNKFFFAILANVYNKLNIL